MEAAYHEIIPCLVLEQMPTELREFFQAQGHTLVDLRADAVRPDRVYHDNIKIDGDIHHAHSYKLHEVNGVLKWLDGDCLERVKGVAADCDNWRASGGEDYKLVCRGLGELSHYIIDAHTYPHLFHGKPWSTHHIPWEIVEAKWIEKHHDEIGPLTFTAYKDIYKAFAQDARMMYPEAVRVVGILEQGIKMTDEENLALARLIATAVGSAWITLSAKWWPKD